MTVIGGAGGAYAGNAVEKNMNKRISYQVRVRMQSGKVQTIYQREIPDVRTGDPVRIKQGRLLSA
jgi:outer membrane lipoprotein SlyB